MDQRPATAHPVPVDVAPGSPRVKSVSRLQKDKPITDSQRRTPDSIEEAAASLFTRVRALINESSPVDCATPTSDVSAHRLGYSTSSYDADTSSSENSDKPTNKSGGDASNFYHLSSSSAATSSGEQIRIQTVPKHSVTSSIVRNDSPMPAHYLHSSTPTNIHKRTAGDRSPKLILGSFPVPETVSRARKQISGRHSQSSTSSAEGDGEVTEGGIDPEKVREQVLSRRPFEPIPVVDPIFSVIYDSSSSSRNSQPRTPDLFAKPLILHKKPQKAPVTPANTVATPEPLISVIPATPVVISSPDSTSTRDDRVKTNRGAYATSTVVAHTGASTPEELIIQKNNFVVGISTVEKSTMTDPEYDEKLENSQVQYFPLETLSRMKFSGQVPAVLPWKGEGGSERIPINKAARYYSQEQMEEVSTYSDSGTNTSVQKYIPRTLYEEYVLSEPGPDKSEDHRGKPSSQSRYNSTSKGQKGASVEQTILPMSTGSFTRIIIDLEDMLNQALELAGRAVTDSHTALEQRDASIRSIRSLRESVLSETDSMKGNAESFKTANDEKVYTGAKQQGSRPAATRTRHKLNGRNSLEASDVIKISNLMGGSQNTQRRMRSLSTENTTATRKRSQQDKVRSHEERSRIPRPSGNFTMSSARSAKFQQRSEADKDEQLLARDLNISARQAQLDDIYSGRFPVNIKQEPGWDWSLGRKRFCAGVACAIVVLIGFIIGCYDGEDEVIKEHLKATTAVTSLGNILFIIGVAIPSLLFWPLSLLHGRKPYVLLSIALTIPLQIPQALSLPPHTIQHPERSMVPFTVLTLVSRMISGFILGFASMNALATIIDLFGPDTGACCRGGVVFNSHIPVEGQDQFCLVPGGEAGARTGVWLGVWAWLFFAFGGVGHFAGQLIISRSEPAWGPWIVAAIATVVVFLVWLVPEVRPPWKKQRVISQRRTGWRGKDELQRVDRGEIKMVVFGSSPYWWWEEVWAGVVLSFRMLGQLGFFVMTIYIGWIAGEIAMVFNLLGTLISTHYKFTLVDTGLAVLALSAGALLSAPVQLSSFYMRNFRHRVHHRANSSQHHYHEGQHPYRTVFLIGILLLPVSSLAFTISATGPPTHFFIPVFFASLVIFSGTLVIAECHLIIMDNFDISNLPEPLLSSVSGSTSRGGSKGGRPHGTQRPTSLVGPNDDFTTCHPAITSAFGILQFVSLIAIAGAVGWSRFIDEGVGIKNGLGIYTGISFLVTIALVAVIWRWKEVRILEVFTERHPEDGIEQASAAFMEEIRLCKVSIFQRGRYTRWSEVNGMIYRVDEEEDAWRVR